MSKNKGKGTDQGRHIAALRDRARRPDPKNRDSRANDRRRAIQEGLQMGTKTEGVLLDPAKDESVYSSYCDADTLIMQIGIRNVMAISGGRAYDSGHGVILPVSNGYKVVVDLMGNDEYRVRRIRIVGTKVWLYGEREGVYCEEVGDVAYYASCFRSYDATEWMHQ